MCGIAGVVGIQESYTVERMLDSLHHRGPDGKGFFGQNNVHLGAVRLAIIDLDAGAQPVYNETGEICIVFNGEIYNYRELRAELQSKGHVFATKTDTEVVIHLYEEFGIDCVNYLRGMFSFAIFDRGQLFLVRDRLGIKPLYYTFNSDTQLFIFASEIKAILQCPEFTPRLNIQALADSVVISHSVATETYIEDIKSLLPGHILTVFCGDQIGLGKQQPYYVRNYIRDEKISLTEALEILENALEDAVKSHLVADVDIGLTLSGGIDSSILALLLQKHLDRPLFTFTVADDENHPDIIQAGNLAKIIGAKHLPIVLTFDDYLASVPSYVEAAEEPVSLYGLPFYFLCGKISQQFKVCLNGEGADELFGGYPDYLDRRYRNLYMSNRLPLLKQLGTAPSDRIVDIINQLSSVISFNKYLQYIFELNLSDPLERHHLVPIDKSAMAFSLEMRVPYLDDRLFEAVCKFPTHLLVRKDLGIQKYILKHFCLKQFGLDLIDIVLRQKLGFPSAGTYLLNRFDQLCNEILPDDYLARHEFGFCFEGKRQLLLFELFHEIFIINRGDSSAVGSVTEFMKKQACKS